VSGEFVAAMEDVLDLYAEPYDPQRPKVNCDETSKQLIGETRQPLPARAGQVARYDYEYKRNGTRNVFLFFLFPAMGIVLLLAAAMAVLWGILRPLLYRQV